MKKNDLYCKHRRWKVCMTMTLTWTLSVFLVFSSFAETFSQGKVSMRLGETTIKEALTEFQRLTQMVVLYNDNDFKTNQKVTADFKDASVEQCLTTLLKESGMTYQMMEDYVLLVPKKGPDQVVDDEVKSVTIKGSVKDKQGAPLPGVTIVLKGTTVGSVTDEEGNFSFMAPKQENIVLVFNFIGMKPVEVKYTNQETINVTMEEDAQDLDEIVVTGYANIKKSSFTGTATRVSKEELLKVSPSNVIDALQVFDPSLRLIKNNLMGSDPNTLPEFYIRGRSGMDGVKALDQLESSDISEYALTNNPNTPVFIMDGYEVTVQKVYDLDPNRIANITILKDAAATALYGSRASNGVIVIETVTPQPGELRVSYALTGAVTAPDLSDYNLANAREMLEIEVAAGLLDVNLENAMSPYVNRLDDYRTKMNNVLQGVNTYWLSQPLKTETNHKHSLYIDGGSETVRLGLGLRYEAQAGVMKKSYRDKLGVEFKVDYRLKGLQIMNQVSFDKVSSQNSPYGSFSDYTKQKPYWRAYDEETGKPIKMIPDYYGAMGEKANPLYEAEMTTNFDRSSLNTFADNVTVNWFFKDHFQLKGQFALTYEWTDGRRFIDPNSPTYDASNTEYADRGDLYLTDQKRIHWNTNALLIYTNAIDVHNINLSVGLNATESKQDYEQTHYRGFPNSNLSEKKYAREVVGLPSISDNHTRLVGTFLTLNYTYNDIYLADASVRFDGSSEFGSDKRWGTFWSFGAGINVHNYEFMRSSFIKKLRIKANYGQTGKVNYPPYAARHSYDIMLDDWHTTGMGAQVTAMGNTKLKWEKTNTLNLAVDVNVNNFIDVEFAWYDKRTKDLITDVSLPYSAGFTSYKDNLGEILNQGYEINVNLALIKKKDWDLNAFIRTAHNKNELLKISDALKEYNERVEEHFNGSGKNVDPILKYTEGGSLTSIYAMNSLGIDPANGKEMFLKRDGKITYDYDASEQIIAGNTEPDLQGSFGINARWKGFTLYTTFLFELGGEEYNQTLVNNVECADLFVSNVDLRVRSLRWSKPGDVAQMKAIQDRTRLTQPTSRFVQKNNMLNFNSLSLGYDFDNKLIKKIGLSMLRLQFNMKDVATFSTVKQERGLSYPFARTFNFSLNASF